MSQVLHSVEIGGEKYDIYGSLQVGDTIHGSGNTAFEVKDEKTLGTLKAGKAPPQKKTAVKKAPVSTED